MQPLPKTGLAAVFEGPGVPMRMAQLELPVALPPGAALCRILLSTICGSDLHTVLGRRTEPTPSILGHESVGEIVAVGEGAHYWDGAPLQIGGRVSWSIMASCGTCPNCARGIPQKCARLLKYGHAALGVWPGLTGGYAEYIYLFPGTAIFPAPPTLPDAVVAPANCALATVVCGVEAIGGIRPGERVLILGAGLLGTYLAALAAEAGAAAVLVADTNPVRLDAVRRFGATDTFAIGSDQEAAARWARERCAGEGADVAFEVCGAPSAAAAAMAALRIGGRLLVAGLVTPGSTFTVDGNELTRKLLTLRGIHNYHPRHLGEALAFLAKTAGKYPYEDLVSPTVPLAEIAHALERAETNPAARVGVRCG